MALSPGLTARPRAYKVRRRPDDRCPICDTDGPPRESCSHPSTRHPQNPTALVIDRTNRAQGFDYHRHSPPPQEPPPPAVNHRPPRSEEPFDLTIDFIMRGCLQNPLNPRRRGSDENTPPKKAGSKFRTLSSRSRDRIGGPVASAGRADVGAPGGLTGRDCPSRRQTVSCNRTWRALCREPPGVIET